MKVRLLKDIVQGGMVKRSRRGAMEERATADGSRLEPVYNPNPRHKDVDFVKGAEVQVSDATGEKWVKQGLAEEVKAKVGEVEVEVK